jgi:hypothetical protein
MDEPSTLRLTLAILIACALLASCSQSASGPDASLTKGDDQAIQSQYESSPNAPSNGASDAPLKRGGLEIPKWDDLRERSRERMVQRIKMAKSFERELREELAENKSIDKPIAQDVAISVSGQYAEQMTIRSAFFKNALSDLFKRSTKRTLELRSAGFKGLLVTDNFGHGEEIDLYEWLPRLLPHRD